MTAVTYRIAFSGPAARCRRARKDPCLMMPARRFQLPLAALLGLLCAQAALAGVVTVNVTERSGSSAENTVIVFDPLDAAPPASHDEASIDQVDKTFVPRVNVVRT